MDYLICIENIKNKLKNGGYNQYYNDIVKAHLRAGTPGEILSSVCFEILEIRNKNTLVFEVINEEANALLNYAKYLGYSFFNE